MLAADARRIVQASATLDRVSFALGVKKMAKSFDSAAVTLVTS